ncbi:U6 snRNA phosphodiesterase 1 isoform X1 [Diabrotica virgifera virgifera]|uniref:U6 snRNA phosphodiesterase n=1 Tax=Diabrotica virgifera virgifera TaxID=50390 RepID=A0A6P7F776_DIAVI|nr:U6 snRNA phosphodiesterase 1 isoform X1 [Diabrotica virgifera virgifera]
MLGKGSLSLLSEYGGDSSDDDGLGPRLSSKRTLEDQDEEGHSFKKRLPVPEVLLKDKQTAEEHVDDPHLHGGRIRSFAHERGNWATFIHIPLDHTEGVLELIHEIIAAIPNIPLISVDDFHISLTKTVILKHHWINSFVDGVRLKTNYLKRFMILFDSLKVYCNEERTRTFIGLQTKTGYDSLIKLVDILNICLSEFKLPSFYNDPSFHMSIIWCVGDYEEELNRILPQLNSKLHDLMDTSNQENWYIYVQFIMCKTGNKHFKFDLT